MPTYEYRCPKGHVFEKFSPQMTSRSRTRCPTCGQRAERLISGGAGLVFKGSGFYITDYKRAGEAKKDEAKKDEAESEPAKPAAEKAAPEKPAGDKPKGRPPKDR
jgi:putative FmdB family regulatory protein